MANGNGNGGGLVQIDPRVAQILRKMADRQRQTDEMLRQISDQYNQVAQACADQPRSITQEIDAIPGRRIFYNLSQRITFTIAQNGLRGQPLSFLISQDGPYIATHYPMVSWLPSNSGATNFGAWSPVTSWPLPTQQMPNQDRIDLSYEVVDSGSQRNFNNEASGPIFSRPDNLIPLPVPTLFSPNSVIQFFPTYERIFFAAPAVPTTQGTLVVTFPGYRIVNL